METSIDLIENSVDIYNDILNKNRKKVSLKMGLTQEGEVGIVMRF